MALKPWKPCEESDRCGDAITFNKKRKLNMLKEQSSLKNVSSHSGPAPERDIIKADFC